MKTENKWTFKIKTNLWYFIKNMENKTKKMIYRTKEEKIKAKAALENKQNMPI